MRLCYNIQYPHKGTSVYNATPRVPNIIIPSSFFPLFLFLSLSPFSKGRGTERVKGSSSVYIYQRVYGYS